MAVSLFEKYLLGAAFAQVLLTFALLFMLGVLRYNAVKTKQVSAKDIALDTKSYPQKARQVANSFANQFELPILFYCAIIISFLFSIGWIEIILAWVFVILRYIHAAIHISTNNVNFRFSIYVLGFFTLVLFYIYLAYRIFI